MLTIKASACIVCPVKANKQQTKLNMKNENKPYTCDRCGQQYAVITSLQSHNPDHDGLCPICCKATPAPADDSSLLLATQRAAIQCAEERAALLEALRQCVTEDEAFCLQHTEAPVHVIRRLNVISGIARAAIAQLRAHPPEHA